MTKDQVVALRIGLKNLNVWEESIFSSAYNEGIKDERKRILKIFDLFGCESCICEDNHIPMIIQEISEEAK